MSTEPVSHCTSTLRPINTYPMHGGCPCTFVRYTLSSAPLIVHACHCTHCQRETGSAFALNAFYEPDRVIPSLSTGASGPDAESQLLRVPVPSLKGGSEGQIMTRCPKCFTVLWSVYAPVRALRIVRVGTVDGVRGEQGKYVPCGGLRPDAHLFAGESGNRHAWVGLEGERVFETMGTKEEYWGEESLERWRVFREGR
ncbi:Mss4-like protein [Phaeosphaeria sp. MPI-PUGE-AT-0046c]|nr:Mss4-like protein [Phaeosphaeria sp. MPI-PUGE-AT-0046c]